MADLGVVCVVGLGVTECVSVPVCVDVDSVCTDDVVSVCVLLLVEPANIPLGKCVVRKVCAVARQHAHAGWTVAQTGADSAVRHELDVRTVFVCSVGHSTVVDTELVLL